MNQSVTMFALLIVFTGLLLVSPVGDPEVKAKPGENVTLHCNTTDACLENCVALVYRDDRLIGTFPFPGPMELKGDDTGNYTCLVRTISVSLEVLRMNQRLET